MVDLGSSTVKAGYAGEDTPKAVFSSTVGWLEKGGGDVEMKDAGASEKRSTKKGKAAADKEKEKDEGKKESVGPRYFVDDSGFPRDHAEMVSPFDAEGAVVDWDVVEAIWEHTLKKRLVVQPDEHPILLGEPASASREQREKMVELLFEKHAPPALFLAKNPVLTSFASGRATALVVDCGGGGTSVTAVHDGYALKQASARSPLGGDAITDIVLKYLEKKKACPIRPRHEFTRRLNKDGETFDVSAVKRPNISSSYRLFKQREIAADVKETTCRLSDRAYDEAEMKNVPTVAYELPDGNVVDVGAERFKIPELLFRPELLAELDLGADAPELKTPDGGDAKGLPALILDVINSCDVDVRKDLFGGMLLAGGGSMFGQLRERLEAELHDAAPTNVRVKMTASANAVERKFATWIGGSILASLGSFQQMWMSKQEYEEHGAQLVHKKCP